ncbi:MAG: hypothetical protein RBU21_15250 [FCB group bacterium]|jgi:hypothetical protein|nr:hypothetical protein [FCB group bacterium]
MCEIAWCSFTWEAAATFFGGFAALFVGFAAVGGAIQVGARQAAIMEKQTEIAATQVELERLKLRSDLYDRRMEIYGATRDWFDAFLQSGHNPDGDRRQRFVDAVYTSEFLFRPEVSARLRQWYDLGITHAAHERANRDDDALAIAQQLIDASNTLHDLFGPDMRVGEPIV